MRMVNSRLLLERVWGNRDIPLRERALWRLLYDSASRAEAVLDPETGQARLSYEMAEYSGGKTLLSCLTEAVLSHRSWPNLNLIGR
jgi:hypothetical protein